MVEVCRRIQEMSTLPHVALRLMEVANNPNSSAREMKEVMEADAALSARVLRCVNSSAYATRAKITNLQQAIAFLGVKQVRNLAMTASVSRLFEKEVKAGPYDRKGLWRHYVSVGVCARLIAMRLRMAAFEDVFLAGLLHDLGISLEDQHVHEAFVQAMEELAQGTTLCELERRHLGFDHTILGAHVGKAWRLPCGVIDSIRHHHDTASCQSQYAEVVRCVAVANFLCSVKGYSSVGVHVVEFPRQEIMDLSLGKEDLVVLAGDFDRELASNQILFQM